MRLVDIFFKNINGQASDIKGNLNNIGHIIMLHHNHDTSSQNNYYNGYFEIDGSTIVNAYDNYRKLYLSLENEPNVASADMMVRRQGKDIKFNLKPALIGMRGVYSGFSGRYTSPQMQAHTHNYWQGEQVYEPTSSTLTQKDPAQYTLRFFIYHGVHT